MSNFVGRFARSLVERASRQLLSANLFFGLLAAAVSVLVALWGPEHLLNPVLWVLPLASGLVYLAFRSHQMYLDRIADEERHRIEVLRLHEDTLAALESARRSEERYALAAAGSRDGLWDWDVASDTLYCSTRWKEMIGLEPTASVTTVEQWLDHAIEEDRPGLLWALRSHVEAEHSHFEHEYRMRHADGGTRWVVCRGIAVRDTARRAVRMAGSQTDITEPRRIRDSLAQAAQHDPLTDLPNRTLFRELLQRAIHQNERQREPGYAVLFIDLDGFKQVNDTYGHVVGDRLLMGIAARFQTQLRPGDSLARLGGDEFAVLVEDFETTEDVMAIAERLHRALDEPIQAGTHHLPASASIGIVVGTPNYRSVDGILRDADIAMYRAKAAGRGGHELFDAAMYASTLNRLRVESELRRAIEKDGLTVFYQPIVQLPSSEICGVEALVRWVRTDGTVAQPLDFIPIAEETGLVVPLTYHVLREACHQVAAWQQMYNRTLDLSVNISSHLFTRPEFIDRVEEAIAESGLLPGSLRLEIPESVLIDHSDVVDQHFQRLRELHVAVHLDNFGSGYASLSYLQRYPVDALKLDKSFVARMGTANEGVGGAIVRMARELGIGLIAEGVETTAHADQLRALECPHAQGYLFSQPLTASELTSQLAGPPIPAAVVTPQSAA